MEKKVALITNIAGYSSESSLGDYSWLLAGKLCENGFKVYCYCKADYLNDEERNSNIELRVYPQNFWVNVRRSLRQEGVTICVLQYLPSVWGFLGLPFSILANLFLLKSSGKKLITFVHETYVRWNFRKPILFVQGIVQRFALIVVAKSSDSVITSIDRYQRQLSRFNKNTAIIPIGSNIIASERTDTELHNLRLKYASNDEIIIGSFGNRDHSRLINIVNDLIRSGHRVKLLLLGGISKPALENMRSQIKKLELEGHVVFTGFLENSDVYSHLKLLDIYVLLEHVTKDGEGGASFKSGSLAAAFSAGLVIVSTRGDMNNKNFETDEVPIILVDNKDTDEEVLNKFKALVSDADMRRRLKAQTQNYFKKHLSWDATTRQYVDVIKRIS